MEKNNRQLISILIPMYNVDKYISKCIESVLNQTYDNIEIILINDGSTDKTYDICKEYQLKDPRIVLVNNINEGVAKARNVAITKASGDYLMFVDADDYILPDCVDYMYGLIIKFNADISVCNYEIIYENTQNYAMLNEEEKIMEFNQYEALENLLYQKELDVSPWGKLYKKEVFFDVEYPNGFIYEDFGTFYKNIFKSQKIVYSSKKKYNYLIRKTSTTGRKFSNKDFDMISLSRKMEEEILSKYPSLRNAINSRLINMYFYYIRRIDKKTYKKEYKWIKNKIKELRVLVNKDKKIKLKVKIGILISYINIDLTKYIYNFFKIFKNSRVSNYLIKYKG